MLSRVLRHFSSIPKAYGSPVQGSSSALSQKVVQSISRSEYEDRQHRLMTAIRDEYKDMQHIVVLRGSPRRYMIDKIPYRFRQDTDMLYLSGCLETDCYLVLHTQPSPEAHHKALMFTPRYDSNQEVWDGPRTSQTEAPDVWPVQEALPNSQLVNYLHSLTKTQRSTQIWYHHDDDIYPKSKWIGNEFEGKPIFTPKFHIHRLRLRKSPAELELMREACRISCEAIESTMRATSCPASENTLAATVDYESRVRGAESLAYPPVVAGGERSNTIHYINNNNVVQPGELVLMDAGCEFRGYSGDVSRAWPVNGKFSPAQRDVYEAVAEVQQFIIEACAQRPSLDVLFSLMCSKMGSALQELCILPRSLSGQLLSAAAYDFCPHHVSHYLGMDVHDTPTIPKSDKIPVGSIITVEPGIYIRSNQRNVDPRYLGIGLRLEDNIYIGEDGVEVLTNSCTKDPSVIEDIVGTRL